jgi:peptidyl-prolyl cis-trans isomerase A (cyclophilin A)
MMAINLGKSRCCIGPIRAWRLRVALSLAVVAICGTTNRAATLSNTEVQFNFAGFGSVDVDLFDNVTPQSVVNFLSYASSTGVNSFDNTVMHRSVPNFVVQGGGFTYSDATQSFSSIAKSTAIPLEQSLANSLGTLGMARTSIPNSATSQWFFNTVDNTNTLSPQNTDGFGYAVFGQVVSGMSVINQIAAQQTRNFSSSSFYNNATYSQLPVTNSYTSADYTNNIKPTASQMITLTSVTVLPVHAAFQNPAQNVDVTHDGLVSPLDALTVINDLLAHSTHAAGSVDVGSNYNYVDVNGDGTISPIDALTVINSLLAQSSSAVTMAGPSVAPFALVPEPSTAALWAGAVATLGAYCLRRRKRRTSAR